MRTAADHDLDQPTLLHVIVSVPRCATGQHYFRVQPPFLRRDATSTNRVVAKVAASVYHDGMALRRVAHRLVRDFWVQPSERMIRQWCHEYAAPLTLDGEDRQPVVVNRGSADSARLARSRGRGSRSRRRRREDLADLLEEPARGQGFRQQRRARLADARVDKHVVGIAGHVKHLQLRAPRAEVLRHLGTTQLG